MVLTAGPEIQRIFPQLSSPVHFEFPNETQTLLDMKVCYCDQLLENTTLFKCLLKMF